VLEKLNAKSRNRKKKPNANKKKKHNANKKKKLERNSLLSLIEFLLELLLNRLKLNDPLLLIFPSLSSE